VWVVSLNTQILTYFEYEINGSPKGVAILSLTVAGDDNDGKLYDEEGSAYEGIQNFISFL